jgi:DNA-binding NtrC family response regulator
MHHPGLSSDQTISTVSDSSLRRSSVGRRSDALMLLLQCDRPDAGSSRHLLDDLDEVLIVRGSRRGSERTVEGTVRRLVLHIEDPRISTLHARLRRHGPVWLVEDAGSKNGSVINGAKREEHRLTDGDVLEFGRTFFRYRSARDWPWDVEADYTATPAATEAGLSTFFEPLAQQLRALHDIARSDLPVLILGPSGSGKELVARAIHALSARSGAYVPVNCGALPENLVEAELFGSRKGAFTGANESREGLVRASDGGTLFLDEIGDLAQRAQPALLRVLQEREVMPVGTTRATPIDLRVVAATHRDLEALVRDNHFRADLLARLSGFVLRLPTLAQRIDDLGLLIAALLRRRTTEGVAVPSISAEAMRLLLAHRWPLNVRELEHALSAAIALSPSRVEANNLPQTIRQRNATATATAESAPAAPSRALSPEQLAHRAELLARLREHRGNISEVARQLGKDRVQIRRWIRIYGISVPSLKQ